MRLVQGCCHPRCNSRSRKVIITRPLVHASAFGPASACGAEPSGRAVMLDTHVRNESNLFACRSCLKILLARDAHFITEPKTGSATAIARSLVSMYKCQKQSPSLTSNTSCRGTEETNRLRRLHSLVRWARRHNNEDPFRILQKRSSIILLLDSRSDERFAQSTTIPLRNGIPLRPTGKRTVAFPATFSIPQAIRTPADGSKQFSPFLPSGLPAESEAVRLCSWSHRSHIHLRDYGMPQGVYSSCRCEKTMVG